jgi:hypothetical protein
MRLPDERYKTAHECELAFRDFIAHESPGKDMRLALASLMNQAFAEERKQQEEWLESAAHGPPSKPLHTLRPMAMPAPPAYESLPLVSSNAPPSAASFEGPRSDPPSAISSMPPPLRAVMPKPTERSVPSERGPDAVRRPVPALGRTSWLVPLGIVVAFLAVLAVGAFVVQRYVGR